MIMELKKGDIVLIRSRTILARIIQLGMNIEKWRWLSYKPFWKKVCNHAAICTEDGIIAEATAKGVVIHSFKKAYGNIENANIKIYRPPLTDYQKRKLKSYAFQYHGTKYQFVNFIQYIPKILFGVWLGRTHVKAENKLYCTGFLALILNKITDNRLLKKYWRTSPAGVQSWCESNCQKIK
jgi:hypothetical protein